MMSQLLIATWSSLGPHKTWWPETSENAHKNWRLLCLTLSAGDKNLLNVHTYHCPAFKCSNCTYPPSPSFQEYKLQNIKRSWSSWCTSALQKRFTWWWPLKTCKVWCLILRCMILSRHLTPSQKLRRRWGSHMILSRHRTPSQKLRRRRGSHEMWKREGEEVWSKERSKRNSTSNGNRIQENWRTVGQL